MTLNTNIPVARRWWRNSPSEGHPKVCPPCLNLTRSHRCAVTEQRTLGFLCQGRAAYLSANRSPAWLVSLGWASLPSGVARTRSRGQHWPRILLCSQMTMYMFRQNLELKACGHLILSSDANTKKLIWITYAMLVSDPTLEFCFLHGIRTNHLGILLNNINEGPKHFSSTVFTTEFPCNGQSYVGWNYSGKLYARSRREKGKAVNTCIPMTGETEADVQHSWREFIE